MRLKNLLFSLLIPLLLISENPIQAQDCTVTEVSTQNGNTSTGNINPQIDGSNVVWQGSDGTTTQIYLYDGSTVTKVSTQAGNTSTGNGDPQIDGSNVVWWGYDGTTYQIYLYDGSTVTKVSTQDGNTSTNNFYQQIDGSNVVWGGYDGTTTFTNQIYLAENCVTTTTGNPEVPTLSEWGLIILALLLMTAGTLVLVQPSVRESLEQEG